MLLLIIYVVILQKFLICTTILLEVVRQISLFPELKGQSAIVFSIPQFLNGTYSQIMLNILSISLSSKRQSKGISPPRQIFKVYNMNIFRFCFLVFFVVMYCSVPVYVCTKDLDGNKPIWLFRAIPGLYLFLCRMFLQFGIFVICTLCRNKMK